MNRVVKLAIVGSRTFTDYDKVKETVLKLFDQEVLAEIVSGGATGADSLAEQLADELGLSLTVFSAEWQRYGRSAGPVRNRKIVKYADFVLAFAAATSRGTANTVSICKKMGKPYLIIPID
ncbi:MAG: DUF2493 domain-containing protein [Kiritimatiellae bacterium]|nr:DUF2493 domain-containing protein [Kiritimatiellia bacterium]